MSVEPEILQRATATAFLDDSVVIDLDVEQQQTNYIFNEPKQLPAGTRVDVKLIYDNSPERAARSGFNSNRDIRWGGPTTDEMAVGFFDYTLTEPMSTPQEIPSSSGGN